MADVSTFVTRFLGAAQQIRGGIDTINSCLQELVDQGWDAVALGPSFPTQGVKDVATFLTTIQTIQAAKAAGNFDILRIALENVTP